MPEAVGGMGSTTGGVSSAVVSVLAASGAFSIDLSAIAE